MLKSLQKRLHIDRPSYTFIDEKVNCFMTLQLFVYFQNYEGNDITADVFI